MSLNKELHERLISRQTRKELERKCNKAKRKGRWTQEDIDYSKKQSSWLSNVFASMEEENEKMVGN